MKSFLLSALALVAIFHTSAQAQTKNSTQSTTNEWFEPAAPAAPASADDDVWGSAPTTTTAAPAAASEEETGYRTGWMSAPGISLSTHQKPTTDYWGKPLKKQTKAAKKAAATVAAAGTETEAATETDPMMRSSGVMVAPGMSSSPYRGVSTDYWGRPLKRKIRRSSSSSLAAQPATAPANADDDTPASW
ncbi:hypothetical protein [Hymenobacter sp. HDW8]|uniref:hypothetical protein n=1 Tax=Hymenobacter sp. HDW8 TaxID=2714932 RepID=UPI001408E9A5|nr:hypothetical protein [Hymenobacter sp. HDW8]QIL76219.1 hypothetical protein G7064_10390 [Hymenobacter sp. HDW8]